MTEYRHASHYQLPTAEMPDTDVLGLLETFLLGGDESCSHAVSADLRWRLRYGDMATVFWAVLLYDGSDPFRNPYSLLSYRNLAALRKAW